MQRYFGMCLSAVILCAVMWSCGGKAADGADKNIVVSIAPLKYVVEKIAGDDFAVEVLVPEGSSPETYSPTPKQMMQVENAEFVFVTDLIDFERELVRKLPENVRMHAVTDVSEGIVLIYGTHDHDTHGVSETQDDHKRGADPHIWTSPQRLKQIASTIYNRIRAAYPDSIKYTKNYARFISELEQSGEYMEEKLAGSGKSYFIIYHPALSYYANDFGLEQVSIEEGGKEPSAAHMKEIARRASEDGIKYIFYQRQFPITAVETIARDAGALYLEVNPLAENIVDELIRITGLIAE